MYALKNIKIWMKTRKWIPKQNCPNHTNVMTDTDSKRIYTENIRISKLLFVWSNVSYRKIILNNYSTIVPKNVWIKVMGKNKNF